MSFYEVNKKYILGSLALLLFVGGFGGGYAFSQQGYSIQLAPLRFIERNRGNAPADVNWQILWDAISTINEKYVERPVDQQQLLYGAVSGMVASLGDPYTVFFTPIKSEEFKSDLKGEFSGIGAEIGMRNNALVVIAPLEDSPAEQAGLKPQDQILKINGESTEKLALDEAVSKIRGPKGSKVTLTIYRTGDAEPREVAIIRDTIVVKSVSVEYKDVGKKKIGVIKLRRFGDDTKGDMNDAVTKLLRENVAGVILDLRNNPGGYITTAVEVASNWVDEGKVIVSEQFGDGRKDPYSAQGATRLKGLPAVVLVNEGSASASEIVAGALHDYGLAVLVGKKTFGKGSVQELVDLPDGTNIKVTIAKWLTPNGKNINIEGIQPDIEAEITQEDINASRDPQMDKALEELGKKL
ncbi:MAG TPA: S41 family peptidase [Patescibacteria group bacterium]|nr:S41 family peptidase [Patescibacteria group bacterium]